MDNTIALLSNISKKLEIISSTLVNSNKPGAQGQEVQKSVINNKNSGINSVSSAPAPAVKTMQPSIINNNNIIQGAASAPGSNISVDDVINFIKSIPTLVKLVAGLSGKTLKQFESVLKDLSKSISNFAKTVNKTKVSNADVKKFKMLIESVQGLGNNVKKIALLAPVVPLFTLSLKLMIPGIKLLSKIFDMFSKMKATKNALNGINALSGLLKGMGIVVASTIAMALAIKFIGIGEILKSIGLVLGIITALSVIALVIGVVGGLVKVANVGMNNIIRFIASMVVMTLATFVLGLIISLAPAAAWVGFGSVLGIMTGYLVLALAAGVIGLIIKDIPIMPIIGFIGSCIFIVTATLVLGLAIKQYWPELILGFIGVVAVITGYMSIIEHMFRLNKDIKSLKSAQALENMAEFMFLCVGVAIGTILVGMLLKNHVGTTVVAFIYMGAIIMGAIRLARIISNMTKGKTIENAAEGLKKITKFMLMCTLVAAAVVVLGLAIDLVGPGKVAIAMGAVTTIIFGAIVLAKIASKSNAQMQKGVKSLFLVTAIIAASTLILGGIIGILKIKKDNEISWGDTFIAIASMTTLVVLFGALCGVAGLVSGSILAGAVPLLAAVGVAAVSSLVLLGIIGLIKIKNENDVEWGDVFAAIGAMTTITVAFGVLCGAAAFALPEILIGAYPLLLIQGIAVLSLGIVERVVNLTTRMKETGLTDEGVQNTIKVIQNACQGFINLIKNVSLEE